MYNKDDPINFLNDLKPYIEDPRYIRVNGKPIIMIYNLSAIPNAELVINTWRDRARTIGIGEILVWTTFSYAEDSQNMKKFHFIDAFVAFPPRDLSQSSIAIEKNSWIHDYESAYTYVKKKVDYFSKEPTLKPKYLTSMLMWDNSARRKNGFHSFYNFSYESFHGWNRALIEYSREKFPIDSRFIFINAWNEWAEGTYLEPDKQYGYAGINSLSRALYDMPYREYLLILKDSSCKVRDFAFSDNLRIALHVHIYYTDLVDEIINNLNYIPYKFDCFVSTDTEIKKEMILEKFNSLCSAENICVEIYENRGRDVAPFLMQMQSRIAEYDYIGHIHSKKTKTNGHGERWRQYSYHNMFGSKENVRKIFEIFQKFDSIGIIFPDTFPPLIPFVEWGDNFVCANELANRLGLDIDFSKNPIFPVGNMFWAKTDAILDVFDASITMQDFPKEKGQVDGTMAHAIERIWVYAARKQGYKHMMTLNHFNQAIQIQAGR